jgi:hypothetical protein
MFSAMGVWTSLSHNSRPPIPAPPHKKEGSPLSSRPCIIN